MSLEWIRERVAVWDADKLGIVGEAPTGTFDRRYRELTQGDVVPGEWWRVESDGNVVGYGWLDAVWGDAEILLATASGAEGKGVGSFIVDHLKHEAKRRGLNYLYNIVRPTHPNAAETTAWLEKRGFKAAEDGTLLARAK